MINTHHLVLPSRDFISQHEHPWHRRAIDNRRWLQKWAQVPCCCTSEEYVCHCSETVPNPYNYVDLVIDDVQNGDCSLCTFFSSVTFYLDWNGDPSTSCAWYGAETFLSGYYRAAWVRMIQSGAQYFWELTLLFNEQPGSAETVQTVVFESSPVGTMPTCGGATTYNLAFVSSEGTEWCDFSGATAVFGPWESS